MDTLDTLSKRLLSRCPSVGIALSKQLINDCWHEIQGRYRWSWRTANGCFAPPQIYTTGTVSVDPVNNPYTITGVATAWVSSMTGRQIRPGGITQPYYTIVSVNSPTSITIDSPWVGPAAVNSAYQMFQVYYPMPADFGYWRYVVDLRNACKLNTTTTQQELAVYDPQRTNFGQTYCVVFRDYAPTFGGIVGPVIPAQINAFGAPVSATTNGFNFPANATYIVQVLTGGVSGTATYQFIRAGNSAFIGPVTTTDYALDLSDGVQVYWPDGITYNAGDLFLINCEAAIPTGPPIYELWPGPLTSSSVYPYQYVRQETDLTDQFPNLPPPMAARGEVILEMALAKCAAFPGTSNEDPNPYFSLALSELHTTRFENMLVDLIREDDEIDVQSITYERYGLVGAPWLDGHWQQHHAPFLNW